MKIDKIFIIHYEPLIDRKRYLDSVIFDLGIPFEYVYNNETTDSLIKENIQDYYCFNQEILGRMLSLPEICVSISHINVYKRIINESLNNCLILEDDAILNDNFTNYLNEVLNEIDDFDFVFLSTCCNLNVKKTSQKYLYETDTSRCTTGYIVNKNNLNKVIELSRTISTTIDAHLNYIKNKLNIKYAWCEPPIITQGSSNVYKSNLR